MADSLSKQHLGEIATVARRRWWARPGEDRISRHIARSEGFAGAVTLGTPDGVYSLFDEMEEKDAHLFSLLQTRRSGVLARGRSVTPASDSERDAEIASWAQRSLGAIPGIESSLSHLLGALARGVAFLEVIWGYDAEGRIVPTALKPRHAGRFTFGEDGALFLTDSGAGGSSGVTGFERGGVSGDTNRPARSINGFPISSGDGLGGVPGLNGSGGGEGRRLPDRKFVTLRFEATDERPYGRGLLERVYWYWWFKK